MKAEEQLEILVPDWALPLYQPARWKCLYGGRGGAKSHTVAEYILACHLVDPNESTVCIREVQKSLDKSSKRLLEQKIRKFEVDDYFKITTSEIRSKKGSGVIAFQGMNDYTADSIKSLEGFKRAWVEEAQVFTQPSLDKLRPTIRMAGSELIFTYNPYLDTDPVHQMFHGEERPTGALVIKTSYKDNPHCTPALLMEAEHDRRMNQEKYDHIWGGETIRHAEARYFKNWRVEEFETPKDATIRLGLDWGFSPHPLAIVGCFIVGRKLYIDREAYAFDCTIRNTPLVVLSVPEAEKLQIVAGSDRPERIRDLNEKGFHVIGAVRGHNSVMQGLEWLETYEIIIHPDCKNTEQEFRMFSHPIDKQTKKVLPGYVDANNHCIEALRYACEAVRRLGRRFSTERVQLPGGIRQHWGGGRSA